MKRKLSGAVFFAAAAMLAFAASAGAVDGTIEINQAKVLANGGTFPYTVNPSGSYRLTGNLTVSGASTNALNVTATKVTIDLNGFSIQGPGSGSSTGTGITAFTNGEVTVENGTVTGFGTGVEVGYYGIVRNVHADANGEGINGGNNTLIAGCTANSNTSTATAAIICSGACAISGNTVNSNAGVGIVCTGNGCVISGNTAIANADGILCNASGCLISGNTAFSNSIGIGASDATTGYGGNVLKNTTNVSGGTSMGNNVCSGVLC